MSKTYFAYIRVSTTKQGEYGSSLTEQKSAIEAYAARNTLSIVGWFEEVETAAKQGRRRFAQMLGALRAGARIDFQGDDGNGTQKDGCFSHSRMLFAGLPLECISGAPPSRRTTGFWSTKGLGDRIDAPAMADDGK